MSIESASLEQLRVHMEYMKETVKALHDRLDNMPTAKQVKDLEERLEALQGELHEQSRLMSTLVNLERFAKWFAAILAVFASGYGLWKMLRGG